MLHANDKIKIESLNNTHTNTINMEHIISRLQSWRKERNIAIEFSRKGYIGNIFEELSEYCRGTEVEDKIDALADICVFSLNNIDTKIDCITIEKNHDSFLYRFSETFSAKYIQEAYKENINSKLNTACIELVKIAFEEIDNLGFNINLVMNETIKEIESRTGSLDNTINKFVKSEGAYTLEELLNKYKDKYTSYKDEQSKWILILCDGTIKDIVKWHKANYKQCKNSTFN